MKSQRLIYVIANSLIRVILLGIVFLLFLHSVCSTSFIGKAVHGDGTVYGKTLNIPDDPWRHLVVFMLVTILCIGVRRINRKIEGNVQFSENFGRNLFLFLNLFFIGMGLVWIALTQLKPGSDPAKVYEIMMQWRAGDFSAFEEGNYLFCYPFQSGIVLFYYILSFLFGEMSFIGLQVVNVISLAIVYFLLSFIARLLWKGDGKFPMFVYLAYMCWIPLFFYITYLYGILPGMACSVGAVYLALKYLEKRKFRYMAGAALCIGAATVLKMNCLIYLVAIACFMAYDAVDTLLAHKRGSLEGKTCGGSFIASIGFIALMGVSVWGCNKLNEQVVEALSGYEMPEGEVMVSWITMGLQEAPKGPGDYNGYNGDVFSRNNYDTEAAKKQSVEDIRKIIERMAENPLDEGLVFFARKTAYQWNDPTFISMERMQDRKSATKIAPFVRSLMSGRGSVALSVALNYVQTLILIGIMLYLLLNWDSRNLYELIIAVVFLGGYCFHMVWEASASYTIPYFTVMIFYAVRGFYDWARVADRIVTRPAEVFGFCRKRVISAVGIAAVLVLVLGLSRTNLFHHTIALDDGEAAAMQYYHMDGGAKGVGW